MVDLLYFNFFYFPSVLKDIYTSSKVMCTFLRISRYIYKNDNMSFRFYALFLRSNLDSDILFHVSYLNVFLNRDFMSSQTAGSDIDFETSHWNVKLVSMIYCIIQNSSIRYTLKIKGYLSDSSIIYQDDGRHSDFNGIFYIIAMFPESRRSLVGLTKYNILDSTCQVYYSKSRNHTSFSSFLHSIQDFIFSEYVFSLIQIIFITFPLSL